MSKIQLFLEIENVQIVLKQKWLDITYQCDEIKSVKIKLHWQILVIAIEYHTQSVSTKHIPS